MKPRCVVSVLLFSALFMATVVEAQISQLSVWKFEATGTNLGTSWRTTGFNDSAWPSGPGVLGFGESYIATTVPFGSDPNNKYRTTYFRRTFAFNGDINAVQSFLLKVKFDDGYAAYLNGQEITRQSMPTGTLTNSTLAFDHEAGPYETVNVLPFRNLLQQGTNVLAVEVHQVSASSSDLVFDAELTTSTASVQLLRGPYLQRGTPSSVIIRWRTDVPTASRVLYGDAPGNLTQIVDNPTLTTEHEVILQSLLPGWEYAYAVGTPETLLAGNTVEYTFKTSPSAGSRVPIRAWIVGDSGTADSNAEAVRDAYEMYTGQKPTDLWLMLGDNAYETGTDAEYQAAVFDMYSEMLRKVALWPTRGNHDGVRAGPANDYYDLFSMPTQAEAGGVPSGTEAYYSFDFGNVHFVCLDSEGSDRSPGGAMLTWLASDLAATDQDWVVAFWHHPPYSEGSHISDDPQDSGGRLRDMRQNALPILEAGGVDAVFCGHSHSYERSYLLDGHYGVSTTLTPSMILDAGDGRPTGDGFYRKGAGGPHPHEGAVYVVAGSSGETRGGPLSHPVMFASLNELGSVVLDIQGNRLEATFLNASGTVEDAFTMIKGAAVDVPPSPALVGPQLSPAFPNPASGKTSWSFSTPTAGRVRLRILDAAGRQVRLLVDDHVGPGEHETQWDGRADGGRLAAGGTYFGVMEFGGEVRTRKLIRHP